MNRWRQLSDLTKPGLTGLVVMTTGTGFLLADASQGSILLLTPEGFLTLIATMIGTTWVAMAASMLNQVFEVEPDSQMERTKGRPLVAGLLSRRTVAFMAIGLCLAGSTVLYLGSEPMALLLALLSLVTYAFVYTPLKRRSTSNTLVGAIPGAIPVMIGWVAATGSIEAGGWALGAILFVWQIPHFLAIAWLYREDYARGGFQMLPITDPSGDRTSSMILSYTLLLLPISALPTLFGVSGWLYAAAGLLLGLGFLRSGFRFHQERSDSAARRLFFFSIIYLPTLLLVMVLDPTRVIQQLYKW